MYKKSFYLTAVLGAVMTAACHSEPTVINSTSYKHEGEKPVANKLSGKVSSSDTATKENSGHETGGTANHSATTSETKPPANTAVVISNSNSTH